MDAISFFIKLFTDPSSGEPSASRFCLTCCNMVGLGIAVVLAYQGQGLHAAAIVTGLAATDAGVYFASTRKDYHKEGCRGSELSE